MFTFANDNNPRWVFHWRRRSFRTLIFFQGSAWLENRVAKAWVNLSIIGLISSRRWSVLCPWSQGGHVQSEFWDGRCSIYQSDSDQREQLSKIQPASGSLLENLHNLPRRATCRSCISNFASSEIQYDILRRSEPEIAEEHREKFWRTDLVIARRDRVPLDFSGSILWVGMGWMPRRLVESLEQSVDVSWSGRAK